MVGTDCLIKASYCKQSILPEASLMLRQRFALLLQPHRIPCSSNLSLYKAMASLSPGFQEPFFLPSDNILPMNFCYKAPEVQVQYPSLPGAGTATALLDIFKLSHGGYWSLSPPRGCPYNRHINLFIIIHTKFDVTVLRICWMKMVVFNALLRLFVGR